MLAAISMVQAKSKGHTMFSKDDRVDVNPTVTDVSSNAYPNLKEYVTLQNYNIVTKFLHSIRYSHLTQFLQKSFATIANPNLFEIGCGYGKSLSVVRKNPHFKLQKYLGIDIENQFISFCQENEKDQNFQFSFSDIRDYASGKKELPFAPNAVIALECFEHINEYDIPKIIEWIASLQCPLFISVPNEIGPAILLKNIGSLLMGYIRHKEYTWMETLNAAIYRLERVTPHGTGHIGFDYRWLAAVINQKFVIEKIGTSPWNFIPKSFSPSIYFYCKPRK